MDKRIEILNDTFKENVPSEFDGKVWSDELLEAMTKYAEWYKEQCNIDSVVSSLPTEDEIITKLEECIKVLKPLKHFNKKKHIEGFKNGWCNMALWLYSR